MSTCIFIRLILILSVVLIFISFLLYEKAKSIVLRYNIIGVSAYDWQTSSQSSGVHHWDSGRYVSRNFWNIYILKVNYR